jgi:hypothetical protein
MINKINRLVYFFLKIAEVDYDKFKEKVERASKSNPYSFSNWFNNNGRAYIDFKGGVKIVGDKFIDANDIKVINFLEGLGYKNIDYYNGYTEKDGRKLRIGKVLNNLIFSNKENNVNDLELYIYIFNNSKFRSGVNLLKNANLKIVFSQDPHDVAMMSTNRGWTSCKDLGKEDNYSEGVFCEVESGGFVAYLIDGDDLEIKHPYARVLIRRFVSNDGKSIAIPEKKVYGENIPEFLIEVNKWVDDHQKDISKGVYELKGDLYSDTFSDKYTYISNKFTDLDLENMGKDQLLYLLNLNGEDFSDKDIIVIIKNIVKRYLNELNENELHELFLRFFNYDLYEDLDLLAKIISYIKLKDLVLIPKEYIKAVIGFMPEKLRNEYEGFVIKLINNIFSRKSEYRYKDVIEFYFDFLSFIPDEIIDQVLDLGDKYVHDFISKINKFASKISSKSLGKIKDLYLDSIDLHNNFNSITKFLDSGVFTEMDNDKLNNILNKAISEYNSLSNKGKGKDKDKLKYYILELKKYLSGYM